jgi:arylsulfatase A-like enzyme
MLKHGIHHKLYSRYFREYLDFYPSETSVLETGDWHNAKWVANMVRNRKDQFFIAYGACKPHLPWYVPQEYFDMHPLDSIKLPPIKKSRYGAYELKQPEHPDKDNDNRRSPFKVLRAHNKLHEAIQGYLAAVSYTDDCFGQIINMLDTDREKREKTIVIVTSDHGYQLGEQKTWAKYNQWQRANRIPLLIRVPGLNPGVCHEPVSSLDIYPTLMDLCGLTAPHELDGNNLKSLLYNVYQDQNRIVHMSSTDGSSYSISRDKRYYYVNVKDGSDKLYDMYEDENQWRNVANRDENVSIVERFKKEIPDFVEPILPFKLDQLKLDHNLKKERESLIQKMKRNRKIGI